MIPATYLIVNYGIDVSNSLTLSISNQYTAMFGTNMYQDAICAEIRATPVRKPENNRNAIRSSTANQRPLVAKKITPFALFEGRTMENALQDPCLGINLTPADRSDEAQSAGNVATRLMMNGSNASFCAAWTFCVRFKWHTLLFVCCRTDHGSALGVAAQVSSQRASQLD